MQPLPGEAALARLGLDVTQARPATSEKRFPDGGAWRVEIPSVEGPARARGRARRRRRTLGVPIHRVSQGSGVMMLTDAEITAMLDLAEHIELSLFLGPRGTWDIGRGDALAQRRVRAAGPRARPARPMPRGRARAAELGVRNVLVADEGVLWAAHQLREAGELPADMRFKVSVLTGPTNPAALRVWAGLGADSINVPSDLSVAQIAELRAASDATLDLYVEAPDDVGGFVRLYDTAELIRVAAPVYIKFGLRNAPGIYPVGRHLRSVAADTGPRARAPCAARAGHRRARRRPAAGDVAGRRSPRCPCRSASDEDHRASPRTCSARRGAT